MKIRGILLCLLICVGLVGCGEKTTEYEAAKQKEVALSQKDQQYLEKNWYGSWQKYYLDEEVFDDKMVVIDDELYDRSRYYVIHNMYPESGSIEYELFDLDTGESEGLWVDTIEEKDGVATIHTEWKDKQFGGMARYILARKSSK